MPSTISNMSSYISDAFSYASDKFKNGMFHILVGKKPEHEFVLNNYVIKQYNNGLINRNDKILYVQSISSIKETHEKANLEKLEKVSFGSESNDEKVLLGLFDNDVIINNDGKLIPKNTDIETPPQTMDSILNNNTYENSALAVYKDGSSECKCVRWIDKHGFNYACVSNKKIRKDQRIDFVDITIGNDGPLKIKDSD